MRRITAASALAALLALPAAAAAQATDPSEAERKALEDRIAKELGATPAAPATPSAAPPPPGDAQPGPAPSGTPPGAAAGGATGANPYARLLALPDLSAIGSFAAAWNDWDVGARSPRDGPYAPEVDRPAFLFQELELGIQAVVDPYVRADVFLSFVPGGVDVEEAYVTTLSLPAGLQVKAGTFFSPFGRINGMHPHAWDFVDAPLAPGRLLAPEKLAGPGVQVAWLAPLPWFAELTAAAQSSAVEADGAAEITGVARLLQYFALGDATTLGFGLSAAARAEGGGAARQLGGADLYLRVRPPASRAYVTLTGEVFARRLDGEGSASWGGYAQAFWRPSPHAGLGARWDAAPSAGETPPGTEQRASLLATWFPSEFLRLRLQGAWDWLPGGGGGLAALLGLEFIVGAHGAHPF
jgi:hypothetical protein